jgi:aspartokinase-like uncharacterized kinase
VKVGGSLYDHRLLGCGLNHYLLKLLPAMKVLIVAGGGKFADYVRELDAWHYLGDEASHNFALDAASLGTRLVGELVSLAPPAGDINWWEQGGADATYALLDVRDFLAQFESAHGALPHTWELTTDSIAAYAAAVSNAKLILLKSVDIPPGTPWEDAAKQGWVDAHFPTVVAKHNLTVEAINFRRWLDELTALTH